MNVEIYALCNQEAMILPYFMRHYNQYGQVFLFASHSEDGSEELAKSLGAIIVPMDTNNEVNDEIFTDVKNNCWKASKADWVIICDTDEFIYHPHFIAYLETVQDTIIVPKNYEMFSDVFPTTQGQIYEEVNMGFAYKDDPNRKMFLFKPQEIVSMNYAPGCHSADPIGNVSIHYESKIISMHMKHLSVDYVVKRNAYLSSRMSAVNRARGWGFHVHLPPSSVQEYFDKNKPNLVKVL